MLRLSTLCHIYKSLTHLFASFYALEKEMATHSSVLAWRIPGTGEPGGLPSVGSHGVGHDWSDLAAAAELLFTFSLWMGSGWRKLNAFLSVHKAILNSVKLGTIDWCLWWLASETYNWAWLLYNGGLLMCLY